MTAPAQQPASGQAGLLERLLAAVRIEFRADILVPGPDDPVLGKAGLPGRRLRPAPGGERPLHRARETVEGPRPPGHDGIPRRPGPAAERPPPADGLLGARLPLRQQRPGFVHAAPLGLGACGMP